MIKMMKTILFQGDSITDAGRNKEDKENLGFGYPYFVGSRLRLESPGKFHFLNKGINENRIVDLYARIKINIINLKPDVMTLLIGVNDVWHELAAGNGIWMNWKARYRKGIGCGMEFIQMVASISICQTN